MSRARAEPAPIRSRAALPAVPGAIWLLFFLVLPLLCIAAISFLTRGDAGEVAGRFTTGNYKRLLGFGLLGFDPLYPQILLRSLAIGFASAACCLGAALPMAFFIASLPGRWKNLALTLVVIPFWTNLLIRTYAWQLLLGPESPLSKVAASAGFIASGDGLHPGMAAVMIGMVCDFLPFMVLPLYASVEKLDWTLAEAAADLGANAWNVFRHALLPQLWPGLAAGFLLVFLPATGQFVIPDLLGGAKTLLLGNVIQQQFGPSRDWPFGAAIATTALALVLAGLWLHARIARATVEREEGVLG